MRLNEEFKMLEEIAETSLENIVCGDDALGKHEEFEFMKESVEYHLMKAVRHITTHLINMEKGIDDDEYHLDNALTRITMAIAKDLE